jgi:hypothetical protein
MSTLEQLSHSPKTFPIRQLAATMLVFLDVIVLGILPALIIIIGLTYLIGWTDFMSVYDLAVWYAPWHIFTGYFCTPLGYLSALIPPGLTIFAARKVWKGEKDSWVVLVLVIIVHSLIAIVGLMYHTELAIANDVGRWSETYRMYTWTRAIFAGAMIGINLLTIGVFRLWKQE